MLSVISNSPAVELGRSGWNQAQAVLSGRSRTSVDSPTTTRAHHADPGLAINPVTQAAVSLEYASLRHSRHCPQGMYVTPSADSPLVWEVVFFVHQGYYSDAVIRFEVTFPPNYPDAPPSVRFVTDVFHPLVTPQTGKLSMSSRFRPWRPKEHHIFDVLHWIKAAFKKDALDRFQEHDCLNKEAFRLYRENTSSYAALALQSSQLSQSPSALYERPGRKEHQNTLRFSTLKNKQLSELRNSLGLTEWNAYTIE